MNENQTNINCEKPIYRNFYLKRWKYSLFYAEIITFLKEGDEN